jgi:hypothetical protein
MNAALCELTNEQDGTMPPTTIYIESKSAIAMGANFKDTNTRHIMRCYHCERENIATNPFTAKWISNEIQIADIGTKLNDGPKHKMLTEMIMITVEDQSKPLNQEG